MKKTIIISSLIILGVLFIGSAMAIEINGNMVSVGGVDFNIPDGFEVNDSSIENYVQESRQIGEGQYVTAERSSVSLYEKGLFGPGEGIININVFSFESEEDAEAHLNYYNEHMIIHDPKNMTVNGIEGFEGGGFGMYSFYYLDGNHVIFVQVNEENSDLIPKIIIN